MKQIGILLSVLLPVLCTSCLKNKVYEKNYSIENMQWLRNDTLSFEVEVTDTISSYNLLINVRHRTDYAFSNLWIDLTTIFPSDTSGNLQVQLKLGDNEEGRWRGDCMTDICDAQISIIEGLRLHEKGKYRFLLHHNMRSNPLDGIMSIGLRLEKQD